MKSTYLTLFLLLTCVACDIKENKKHRAVIDSLDIEFEQACKMVDYSDSMFHIAHKHDDFEGMRKYNDSTTYYTKLMVKHYLEIERIAAKTR